MVVLNRAQTVTAEDLRPHLRGVSASGGSDSLVAISRSNGRGNTTDNGAGSARERELIYRALLELRMEIREIKEQLQSSVISSRRMDDEDNEYLIVNRPSEDDAFEEVVYEIESEDHEDPVVEVYPDEPESQGALPLESGELPTLQDAERRIIAEALRRFDGNHRQTAKALGISERTLYRKINEMEEDGKSE
jgi:DNA-binding NtrC family response regulator